MATQTELDEAVRELRASFLVPPDFETLAEGLNTKIAAISADFNPSAEAFKQSLHSFLSTMSMPFALANSSVSKAHFTRIFTAERIRARKITPNSIQPGELLEEAREREAERATDARFGEFIALKEGQDAITEGICSFLLQVTDVRRAAEELLRQGVILLWSAFEVFFRDVFEVYINRNPSRVEALTRHPDTRKRFDTERITLDVLMQHDFNLSGKVGSFLVTKQDFSDLRLIKTAYPVLFPNARRLIAAIGRRELWVLFQRRHLIVHRRGIVDQSYLDESGDSCEVGSRITITPARLEEDLSVVLECGEALCETLGLE